MDKKRDKLLLEKVMEELNMPFDYSSDSLDQFLPIIEKMRLEGAVVLLKWDGERGVGDNGPCTALVSGKVLQGDFFRTDADSMKEALTYIIANYARQKWNIEG
jgi:hypothetical protein